MSTNTTRKAAKAAVQRVVAANRATVARLTKRATVEHSALFGEVNGDMLQNSTITAGTLWQRVREASR